jgi:hypothetical protein
MEGDGVTHRTDVLQMPRQNTRTMSGTAYSYGKPLSITSML